MKNDDELMSAEEFFGVKKMEPARPRPAAVRRMKQAAKDILFGEIKVKMVMRIYNVSRARALEMIAGRAADKAALENAAAAAAAAATAATAETDEDEDGELMSAEDFFGACD